MNNNDKDFKDISAACTQYDERLMSIDQFDKENNIVDLDDDLKAEAAKRLGQVDTEIQENNEKYAKGEASSGMKLYPWSDESKDEIEAEKMGLSREWDPSRGVMLHQKELWD